MLQQGLFSHQCAHDVAWFQLLKGGGKERLVSTCLCRQEVPMVTCILLRYAKIMTKFILPAERPSAGHDPCETHLEAFEVRNYTLGWQRSEFFFFFFFAC